MSRTLLVCPACAASSPPRITGPNRDWHMCPECWTKTPLDELRTTHDLTATTLRGKPPVRLLQTLYATGGRNVHYTDPVPGTGTISEDQPNTIPGTHDDDDTSADIFTLSAIAQKSSGTAFVDYTLQPAQAPGQIAFVRYWIRVAGSGDLTSAGHVQMDHRGLSSAFPDTTVDTDWKWMTADINTFDDASAGTSVPWTNALVDTAQWFIEIPLSIQNGSPSITIGVSEMRLELWGDGL